MSAPISCGMHSGKRINPFDLAPELIDINDIAHHLSMLCRFNGAVDTFYSVAEHSVRVSRMAERATLAEGKGQQMAATVGLYGLLHDGSEAYLSDIISQLKQTDLFAAYRALEADVQQRVYARFGLTGPTPEAVHVADKRMVGIEGISLLIDPSPELIEQAGNSPRLEHQLRQSQAKHAFLMRFEQLGGRYAA